MATEIGNKPVVDVVHVSHHGRLNINISKCELITHWGCSLIVSASFRGERWASRLMFPGAVLDGAWSWRWRC